MKTHDHIRHRSHRHNRYKARHHVKGAIKELEALEANAKELWAMLSKMSDQARFLYGRLCRIDNRLKAEDRQ